MMPLTLPSSKRQTYMFKLPNFVGICRHGFDPATYDFKAEMRNLELKKNEFRLHNMIRWRVKRDAAGGEEVDERRG